MSLAFEVCHQSYMIFGAAINGWTLLVISTRTPKPLKDYSIILLYTVFNDLVAMILHFLLNPRLFATDSVVINIASGPCQLISDLFCQISYDMFHYSFMNAISLIAISFWYRKRVLQGKGSVSWCKLQFIILIALFVHFQHLPAFLHGTVHSQACAPFIAAVYGANQERYSTMFGFLDMYSALTSYCIYYFFIFPCIIYPYIFITRRSVLSIFSANGDKMCARTREMHHSLIKLLSIHTLLPSCCFFGFIFLFFQMTNLYHSIEIEALTYTIPVSPSVINPILTLYFIKPYKTFMLGLAYRKRSFVISL